MCRCGTWGYGYWCRILSIFSSLNDPVILWSVVNLVLWYNKTRVNCVAWGDLAGDWMGRKDGVPELSMNSCSLDLQYLNKLWSKSAQGELLESVVSIGAKKPRENLDAFNLPFQLCQSCLWHQWHYEWDLGVCGLVMLKCLSLYRFGSQPLADTSFGTPQSEVWLLSALTIIAGKRAASREKARSAAVMFGGVSPLVPAGPGSECS